MAIIGDIMQYQNSQLGSRLDKIITTGLILLVCVAPLPLGSNNPISYSIIAVMTGILLFLWVVDYFLSKKSLAISFKKIWFIVLPFFLTVLWIILQIFLPAPPSPNLRMFDLAFSAIGIPIRPIITLNQGKTLDNLMRLLSYGGIFWIALQTGQVKGNARRMFKAVTISAVLYALYGLIMYLVDSPYVVWRKKISDVGFFTGTFINHNHYATYAGICLIIACALWISTIFKNVDDSSAKLILKSLLENIVRKGFILFNVIMVIAISLMLTNSRAGIFSSILSLIAFICAIAMTRPMRNLRYVFFAIVGVVLLSLIAVLDFTGKGVLDRLAYIDSSIDSRVQIYSGTWSAIKDYKIYGSGYGTFEDIFKSYQPESMYNIGNVLVDYAHNTYIETILELGLVGFVALLICHLGMFYICAGGIKRRTGGYIYPAAGIGIIVLVSVHSLFDFSIEIPAVAVTYSALLGACVAGSWPSREGVSVSQ